MRGRRGPVGEQDDVRAEAHRPKLRRGSRRTVIREQRLDDRRAVIHPPGGTDLPEILVQHLAQGASVTADAPLEQPLLELGDRQTVAIGLVAHPVTVRDAVTSRRAPAPTDSRPDVDTSGRPTRIGGVRARGATIAQVASPQTLSERDRQIVAGWAADCAEHVLEVFEAHAPDDPRPREAIARARAFARGELDVAGEIRRRFVGGSAAREVAAPAAVAAARAAGQAAAVAHMGAHALGAAAYAAQAAGLSSADGPAAVAREIEWQLGQASAATRTALRRLPAVGENRSGPLGPGRLASGQLGAIVRELQAGLACGDSGEPRPVVAPR